MLISALCDYYDVLESKGEVLKNGYSKVSVSYAVSLTPEGKIDGILDVRQAVEQQTKNGKTKKSLVSKEVVMPKRSQKPGIDGNIVEHRPLYIFGLNLEKGELTPFDKTNKAQKSHKAFVDTNLVFIEEIDSPVVNAFRNFLLSWNPEEETQNPFILNLEKDFPKVGYEFCLSGRPDLPLHEDPFILKRWEEHFENSSQPAKNAVIAQCAVYGDKEPIARIHEKIKGLSGGLQSGNTLVNFKNSAMSSYGNEQSFNSNISQKAMEKYTTALNMLLADRTHKSILDDITVVHWASSGEKQYDDFFEAFAMGNIIDDSDEQVQSLLKLIMSNAAKGTVTDELLSSKNNIDPDVDFYIVGLKPNSARISVKFIYRKRFGEILENFAAFQNDLAMKENGRPISFWQIKKELIPPKSKDNVNPTLMSKLLDSIVYSRDFPQALLSTVIWRVKVDSDEEKNQFIKLNDVRMGIIKGCINRKARLLGQKEEIKMALDKENENVAYLCGRLFAVLEAVQQKASNYSLNRTIKDSYFSSASSKPATVFPNLMRLSQYHLSKIGDPVYFNNDIKEIMDKLPGEFPQSLPLIEQGKFMIGYYQQRSYSDTKRKEAKAAKEEN